MRIALDYDGTYTADPVLWEAFINSAKARGHTIICVTKRWPQTPTNISVETIYTCGKAKVPLMKSMGIQFDIWIDDTPGTLLYDDGNPNCQYK